MYGLESQQNLGSRSEDICSAMTLDNLFRAQSLICKMGITCPQNLDVLIKWNPECKETRTVPSLSNFFFEKIILI